MQRKSYLDILKIVYRDEKKSYVKKIVFRHFENRIQRNRMQRKSYVEKSYVEKIVYREIEKIVCRENRIQTS